MVVLISRLALLLALCCGAAAHAQESELRVKAAYLYRFGGFVEWPEAVFAASSSPFVIGVMGADALAAELAEAVAGRAVQSRKVEVRAIARGAAPENVHVLFIGHAENARIAEITAGLRGHPVLVVTESENAVTRGSMINFVTAENKVRFDVALPPAEKGHLRISARLLTVARKVIGGTS